MVGKGILEVVGFDLGHGETAAARAIVANSEEPTDLEINGETNQVTAVAVDPDGKVIVGKNAVRRAGVVNLDVTFKARPNDRNRDLLKRFMRACHAHLTESKVVSGNSQSYFYVGCPSGWGPADQAEYGALLREAGIDLLKVIPESRAAFMQAKESKDLQLTLSQLKSTVLSIDIGSSTTDFTVVVDLKQSPIPDDGDDLGAGLIDKAIMDRLLTANPLAPEACKVMDSYQPSKALCEIECRRAKEEYFNDQKFYDDDDNQYIDITVRIDARTKLEMALTGPMMQEILDAPLSALGGRSWKQAYRGALEKVKARMAEVKLTPSVVLLTGGAARMPFTVTICQEVFPTALIKREPKPQYSVSRGLARVGRAEIRSQSFLKDIDAFCSSDEFRRMIADRVPSLFTAMTDPIADGLVANAIKPGFKDWREGKVKTLADLKSETEEEAKAKGKPRKIGHIEKLATTWMQSPAADKLLQPKAVAWIQGIQAELQARTDEIAVRHGIPKGIVRLTLPLTLKGIKLPGMGPGSEPTDLTAIADLVGLVVAIVVACICGGAGMHLIIAGPIGWIIGFVIAAAAWAFGRDAIVSWIETTEWPVWIRKWVLDDNKIDQNCTKERPNIIYNISNQLKSRPDEANKLIDGVRMQFNTVVQDAARDGLLVLS